MSPEWKKDSYQVVTMFVYGKSEKLFAIWSIGNLRTWENSTHMQSFNQLSDFAKKCNVAFSTEHHAKKALTVVVQLYVSMSAQKFSTAF